MRDGPATTALFMWDVPAPLRVYFSEALADRTDLRLVFPEDVSESVLLALAPEADVLIGWRPSSALLDAAGNLRLFINPGVGVQHLLQPFRELNRTRSVQLANGHGNTYFTAQHAVAMLLALTNQVVPHHTWMQQGRWRMGDAHAKSTPLRDRHVGLLGYGAVNQKVHRMLSGFDVRFSMIRRTSAGDPTSRGPDANQHESWGSSEPSAPVRSYRPEELHAFLSAVDILVVAAPLTDETEGLIGATEVALLGPTGLLVNVGRGAIVEEEALYEAVHSGMVAGAAIDVWYEYRPEVTEDGRKFPYDVNHPFHKLDNVVLSPHRAASPFDDLRRWDEVIDNLARVADGRDDLRNLVDLERGY